MFFTPFAFFQNAVVVAATPAVFTGYYIGGGFTTYATATQPYFRMLDSSGSISSSFNIGDGFDNSVFSAATQSDGKILVGGTFTTYSGSSSTRIVRINPNGTKDTTFNPGTTGASSIVNSIKVQNDGKIVLGGQFSTYSGSTKNYIARANTDGTADTGSSWNTGVGFNNIVYSLAVQSDQKILVGGAFTTYSGSTKNYIVRLNTDGTADTGSSWNQGVGFGNIVYSLAVQSDQKILAGGIFTTYSGSTKNYIVRLNTDGTADTGSSWNQGTGFSNVVYSLAVQSDQKILAVGAFTTYSGSTKNYITRINTNGTVDNTFNVGTGFDNTAYFVAIQPDGKILVQGTFSNYSGSIALGAIRLNSDGTLDTTFNRNFSINSSTSPVIILPFANNNSLIGGNFTGDKNAYTNFLTSSGTTTSRSTISLTGINSSVNSIVSQSDGKLVFGGAFTAYSGSSTGYILRLNADLTKDTGSSWNTGVGFNSNVQTIVTQSDGKLLVGGLFTQYSGSANIVRIARLNTNGTLDTTFNPGTTGASSNVNTIVVQNDGKIVLGGQFSTYSGSTRNGIARLNTDGTIDSAFNVGTGASPANINRLALQSDQKILAVGAFTLYSGSFNNGIVRINTDGTKDTTFTIGNGLQTSTIVSTVTLQPDQKILVGGFFTTYSGSSSTRIVRINTNGTKDATFNTGTGANSNVLFFRIEPETDKILAGGNFTTYSGSTANRIMRLNTDGTIDTTFTPVSGGFNSNVNFILPY